MTRAPEEKAKFAFIHEVGICAVTGRSGDVHCAHVRFSDAFFGKANPGMGTKPEPVWTLPLSPEKHQQQHGMGEAEFWRLHGYDPRDPARSPLTACLVLDWHYRAGDVEAAQEWLRARIGG